MYSNWERDNNDRQRLPIVSPRAPIMFGAPSFPRPTVPPAFRAAAFGTGGHGFHPPLPRSSPVLPLSRVRRQPRPDRRAPAVCHEQESGKEGVNHAIPSTTMTENKEYSNSTAIPKPNRRQKMSIWASWKKAQEKQKNVQEATAEGKNPSGGLMESPGDSKNRIRKNRGFQPCFGTVHSTTEVCVPLPVQESNEGSRIFAPHSSAFSGTESFPFPTPVTPPSKHGVTSTLDSEMNGIGGKGRGGGEGEREEEKEGSRDDGAERKEAKAKKERLLQSSFSASSSSLLHFNARSETAQFPKISFKNASFSSPSPATVQYSSSSSLATSFLKTAAALGLHPPYSPRRLHHLEEEKKKGEVDLLSRHSNTAESPSLLEDSSFIKVVEELPPSFRDFDCRKRSRGQKLLRSGTQESTYHTMKTIVSDSTPETNSFLKRNLSTRLERGAQKKKEKKGKDTIGTRRFSYSLPVGKGSRSTASRSLKGSLLSKNGTGGIGVELDGGRGEEVSGQGWGKTQNNMIEGLTPLILSDLNATLTGNYHSTFERTRSVEGSPNNSKTNISGSFLKSSEFSAGGGALLDNTHHSFNSTFNINDTIGRAERAAMLANMKLKSDVDEGLKVREGVGVEKGEREQDGDHDKLQPSRSRNVDDRMNSKPKREGKLHETKYAIDFDEPSAEDCETLPPSPSPSSVSPPSLASHLVVPKNMEGLKAAVRLGEAFTEEGGGQELSPGEGGGWTPPLNFSGHSISPPLPYSMTGSGSGGWHPNLQPTPSFTLTNASTTTGRGTMGFLTGVGGSSITIATATEGGGMENHFPLYSASSYLSHPLAYAQQLLPSNRTMAAISRLCPQPLLLAPSNLSAGEGLSVQRLRRWYGPSTVLTRHGYHGEGNEEEESKQNGGVGPLRGKGGRGSYHVGNQCSVWSEAQSLFRGRAASENVSSPLGVSRWGSASLSSRSDSTSEISQISSRRALSVGWIQSSPLVIPHPRKKVSGKDRIQKEEKKKSKGGKVGFGAQVAGGGDHSASNLMHHPHHLPPLQTWERKKDPNEDAIAPFHSSKNHRSLTRSKNGIKKCSRFHVSAQCFESSGDGKGTEEDKDDGILNSLVFMNTIELQRNEPALLHRAMKEGIRSIRRKVEEKPLEDETIRMVRQWCDRTSVEKKKEGGGIVDDPRREHQEAMDRVLKEEESARSLQHFSRLRHREKLKMESEAARDALSGFNRLHYPSGSSTAEVGMRKMMGEEWSTSAVWHPCTEETKHPRWDANPSFSLSAVRKRMMMMGGKNDGGMVKSWKRGNLLFPHQELCSRLNPFDLPEDEKEKNIHEFISAIPGVNAEDSDNDALERSMNCPSADNLSLRQFSRRSTGSSVVVSSINEFSPLSISPPLSPLGLSITSTIPALMPTFLNRDGTSEGGTGVGVPSAVENALLDLLLLALVENSVWGNPNKPNTPKLPYFSLSKGDVSRTSKKLASVYLNTPVEFTDLCQLSEVHAGLAALAAAEDPRSVRTAELSLGAGINEKQDERAKTLRLVPSIPSRATVAPNGCRVFFLRFFEKERKGDTGLKSLEPSPVEVLPLHLNFLLRRPIEEGGTVLRCCAAVDLLQLFLQLPSILAEHLVHTRGGGPTLNPVYAGRMPQWCKNVWCSVMLEIKRELVSAYVEESKYKMGVPGLCGMNVADLCEADRLFLEQQLLRDCRLETFAIDWEYCLALSRWRVSSLKHLADVHRGVDCPPRSPPFAPPVPSTCHRFSLPPEGKEKEGSRTESTIGAMGSAAVAATTPRTTSPTPSSTNINTTATASSSFSFSASGSCEVGDDTSELPLHGLGVPPSRATLGEKSALAGEQEINAQKKGKRAEEKGSEAQYVQGGHASSAVTLMQGEKSLGGGVCGSKEQDKGFLEEELSIPVTPGPRVYYPLDMQTLYVTASLALDQNNAILFPRIELLRTKYEELESALHEAYARDRWHRRQTKREGGGGGSGTASAISSHYESTARGSTYISHHPSSCEVWLPSTGHGPDVEKPGFGFAIALQQWSAIQKILDTETSYQLCLQNIHLNEVSIINFNAHVTPYNTYRAKESSIWGRIYLSGLRLAYALCVYLESKPLYCMPENFSGLFYPLAQFSGCADGYREMKVNLKAVKTSISERCRRVSLAVEMMTVESAEKLLQRAVEVLTTKCQTASEIISCQAVEEDVLTTSISPVPLPEKKFAEVGLLAGSEDMDFS